MGGYSSGFLSFALTLCLGGTVVWLAPFFFALRCMPGPVPLSSQSPIYQHTHLYTHSFHAAGAVVGALLLTLICLGTDATLFFLISSARRTGAKSYEV